MEQSAIKVLLVYPATPETFWSFKHVLLSAMIVHKESVDEIVNRCRAWGKPVIAGRPLFTTGHAAFPEIGHFVLGEAEELMPQVVEDMRRGTVQLAYWRFCIGTLLRRPHQFHVAVELAIVGYHFRRVASLL